MVIGSCEDIERLLVDYLLEELPTEADGAVKDHVGHCPACRRLLIVTKYAIRRLLVGDSADSS